MIGTAQLLQIMPNAGPRAALYAPHLTNAMVEFYIDSPARQAAFLAQVAHESGELRYAEEIATGVAYDHRADLGNTRPEAIAIASKHGATPGRWWKGHGPIQITGYDNHLACGIALGLDLLNNPTLITKPLAGSRSSAWFWAVFKALNPLADAGEFRAITRRINGGYNGLAERLKYWERAKLALGVTP